jgi:hypothetical protein
MFIELERYEYPMLWTKKKLLLCFLLLKSVILKKFAKSGRCPDASAETNNFPTHKIMSNKPTMATTKSQRQQCRQMKIVRFQICFPANRQQSGNKIRNVRSNRTQSVFQKSPLIFQEVVFVCFSCSEYGVSCKKES